jgi:hypothetical protein
VDSRGTSSLPRCSYFVRFNYDLFSIRLVATKIDLINDPKYYQNPKNLPVSYSEGVELAKKHCCVGFLETSALTFTGLDFINAAVTASCKQSNFKPLEKSYCNLQ